MSLALFAGVAGVVGSITTRRVFLRLGTGAAVPDSLVKCAKSVIRGPYIKGEDAAKPVVKLGEAEDVVSGLSSKSRCKDAVVSAVCGGADTVKEEVCQCFFRVSTDSTGGG